MIRVCNFQHLLKIPPEKWNRLEFNNVRLQLGVVEFGMTPIDLIGEVTVFASPEDSSQLTDDRDFFEITFFVVTNPVQTLAMKNQQTGEIGVGINPLVLGSMRTDFTQGSDYVVTLPPHAITYLRDPHPKREAAYRETTSRLTLATSLPTNKR